MVTNGPYQVVRHPMYAGFILMTMTTPLVLGSYVAELPAIAACTLLIMRLLAEERFLTNGLPGYTEYTRQTRRRLLPGPW